MRRNQQPTEICHRCLRDVFPKKVGDKWVLEDYDGNPHECVKTKPKEEDQWP